MSDRGMKKWAPYKSLNEQWSTLDNIDEEQKLVEKPKISNEMAEEINDRLVNYSGQEYSFYYYKNGRILEEKSTIRKIDALNRILVLDNGIRINLKDLLEIR